MTNSTPHAATTCRQKQRSKQGWPASRSRSPRTQWRPQREHFRPPRSAPAPERCAITLTITKRKADVAKAYGMATKVANKSILVARTAASNVSAKEARSCQAGSRERRANCQRKSNNARNRSVAKIGALMAAADAARSRAREQELGGASQTGQSRTGSSGPSGRKQNASTRRTNLDGNNHSTSRPYAVDMLTVNEANLPLKRGYSCQHPCLKQCGNSKPAPHEHSCHDPDAKPPAG